MSKTAMFLDGHFLSNVRHDLPSNEINYHDFVEYYEAWRSFVYLTMLERDKDEENKRVRFADALAFSGFHVVLKRVRVFDNEGAKKLKGENINVDIAIGMMQAAEWADEIILFAGDADLVPAVLAVQIKGVRVTIAGKEDAVSPELRKAADDYEEIKDILEDINKKGK